MYVKMLKNFKSENELNVGDKFIWLHQGTAFVSIIKKIGKETYFDGDFYIKKRNIIKWNINKQKVIDKIYRLQDKIMELQNKLK